MYLSKNLARGILVSPEDEKLLVWNLFTLDDKGYPNRNVNYKPTRLHKFILVDVPDGFCVDHVDGNRLNNRRDNLRLATKSQNAYNMGMSKRNTSGYKGVSQKGSSWTSTIRVNGVSKHLGLYPSKEQAARIYDDAAKRYHGEFAVLNFN